MHLPVKFIFLSANITTIAAIKPDIIESTIHIENILQLDLPNINRYHTFQLLFDNIVNVFLANIRFLLIFKL